MAAQTPIEWTDATWNPIGGCSIHSPGCANCYAMKLAARHPAHPVYAGTVEPSKAGPVWTGKLTVAPDDHPVWRFPLSWRGSKQPVMGEGKPSLIFVGDMSDLFHELRPEAQIGRVFGQMGACAEKRSHIFQCLTKRPDRMADYVVSRGYHHYHWYSSRRCVEAWPPRNIWFGCSIERQQEADERRPHMKALADRGYVTFISYEPALGPVDWTGWEFVKQIISGGESDRDGKSARPSHPDWHRATRDFCAANRIAYFFKQWGAWWEVDSDARDPATGDHYLVDEMVLSEGFDKKTDRLITADGQVFRDWQATPEGVRCRWMTRLGKKAAGRILDGRTHSEFPATGHEVRA